MVKATILEQRYKDKPNLTLAYLEDVAMVFDCHPRTILRAITGNPTEYWAPSHNPRLQLRDVTRTFSLKRAQLVALLTRDDTAIRPTEASEILGISARTLRSKRDDWRPFIVGQGFIRYSKANIDAWHEAREEARRKRIAAQF